MPYTLEADPCATSRRTALERFLSDGRIKLDSNAVERAIPATNHHEKKRALRGSHGGRTSATIATLLQTNEDEQPDPHSWLTQTLERIARRWPISQIDTLMP